MEGSFAARPAVIDMAPRIDKTEHRATPGVGVAMLNLALVLHVTSDK